jgi:hypothetical protein
MSQSLRQSSQQQEIAGQGMEAMLLAVLPVMLQVGVEGEDVLLKEAVQAVVTAESGVAKGAVRWGKATIHQL